MKLICALGVLLLSACVTPQQRRSQYAQKLDGWVGTSESDLVKEWGAPTSSHPIDGGKVLTYVENAGSESEATYDRSTRSTDVETTQLTCTTHLIFQSGVLAEYRFSGNHCR